MLACPLRYLEARGADCPGQHKHWAQGGCMLTMATSVGARLRYQLDRDGELFRRIFKERTATERTNSQAKELGIERPMLRNGKAIANQNALNHVLVNLRALQWLRAWQETRSTPVEEVTALN